MDMAGTAAGFAFLALNLAAAVAIGAQALG
jgi:hypothetical protein